MRFQDDENVKSLRTTHNRRKRTAIAQMRAKKIIKTMKYIRNKNNKIQRNIFKIYKFDHATCLQCFYKLSAKNWPSDILFVGNINKYVIIMHLICINHNIINRFSAKKGRSNTLYMCLDTHAKFRGDRPLWAEIWRGGSNWPPPPSKNLLSKSPVKIGLRKKRNVYEF